MRFFRRRRTDTDFSDEVRTHLDLEADRLIADGMRVWLGQLAQDLRYAWRGMRRSPSFVATTVLTLAVGLGLLTIAFTIFNAYVLRPFAVRDPGSLHLIAWRSRDSGGMQFRWRDYQALASRTDLFSASIAEHGRFISSNGRPLLAALVSANYFEALAPAIHSGRGLGAIDDGGTHTAVVLSHLAWLQIFEGDPSTIGRTVDLNGRAFTIVGVTAPAFTGLSDERPDVWVPLATYAAVEARDLVTGDQTRALAVTVRLRPGVTAAHAATALGPLMSEIIEIGEDVRAEIRVHSSPNALSLEMLLVLSPVFAAFVLVLATACANVSNVMLARAIARHREIAVRLSIGASRGRVVRQLLTEGLLLAVLAGLTGLGLAAGGLRAATALLFSTLPASVAGMMRLAPLTFDYRVFLFALTAAAAATLLFALLPALQASRLTLTDALRGQGGAARRGSRLRNALVIGQVAVSIVLVILAVTLARNGAAIGAIDLGFATDGVISVNLRGTRDDLARPVAMALAEDPRVAEVAVSSGNPLFNSGRRIAAAPSGGSTAIHTPFTFASPEYFSILRIPIARGRAFRDDEAREAARVAIVSASTANAMWPGQDPIGQTFRIEPPNGRRVSDLPGYSHVTVVGRGPRHRERHADFWS